jgi:CubicO group peptidase (beta-lactamase class C family)
MLKSFLLCSLLFFTSPVLAQQKQQEQIDDILSSWDKQQYPGLAVMVSQGDTTLYKRYFGLADLAHKSKINNKTTFQIASVSKQFTAFAIALLVSENKLSLHNDIRRYLPELKNYDTPITVLHLIHHTSGLRDIDDLNSIVGTGFSDYNDTDDVYRLIMNQSALNFTPGERYDYSNSGYMLLAKIVEKVTGLSFRVFMEQRVFTPLGMHNTLVFDNAFEVVPNRASAYFSGDGKTFSRDNGISAVYGSTGIYTSLEDLDRWARNFTQHKVGDQAIFDMMLTTGTLNNGESTHYAFGQELKTYKGHQAVFHGGGTGAYRAYVMRFPKQKLSISFLSNNSYSTAFIIDYVHQIADLYLETKVLKVVPEPLTKASPTVTVADSVMLAYQGNYQIQPGLIFSVERYEKNLQLLITGNSEPIPLRAVSANKFILMDNNSGNRIIFNHQSVTEGNSRSGGENTNAVQSIRYFQGDFEYKAQRVEIAAFDVQDIAWHNYEGLFYSQELNTVYKLMFDGTTLKALHARNLPIELRPFQAEVFTTSATYFQEVKFSRNKHGLVVKMIVSGARSKGIEFVKLETPNKAKVL